jgi:hypothetical protein
MMSQFYLHLRTPAGLDRDDIGLDLDGVETAYLDAYATIPAMSADLLRQGADPYQHAFEIMDAKDNFLMEVPFYEVLDRRRTQRPSGWFQLWQQTRAELEQAKRQTTNLEEERTVLQATLAETKWLLAEAQKVVERTWCRFPAPR